MKTLIFSDVHNEWEWIENIINKESPDWTVFCGDHFDRRGEEPSDISETADWFHWSVNQPNRIHLFGNHDVQYAFPHDVIRVSNYAQWKKMAIDAFVFRKDWAQLKYYYILDNTWLITHAGLHPHYVPAEILANYRNRNSFYGEIAGLINSHISRIDLDFNNHQMPIAFSVGTARKGWADYGHILWCDFDKEFTPIQGINQIFGHTPQKHPKWKVLDEEGKVKKYDYDEVLVKYDLSQSQLYNVDCSFNLCLDTKDRFYAIWKKKKLKIKQA